MSRRVADIASILRFHIILVAVAAALVFGWLFTGKYLVGVAVLGGLDWLLINLLNKISDVEEDTVNEIRGTQHLADNRHRFWIAWIAILVGSVAVGHWLYPELTPWRVVVQLIGVGYSYPLVPTPSGFKRFKAIYFLKNFMSSVLFVLTVFVYGLVHAGFAGSPVPVILLVVFFMSFELTYEILYDLRDLEGDKRAGIPTYPVVHGAERSRQIIDGLLLLSGTMLVAGFLGGVLGVRELMMVAAPGLQFIGYRRRFERGLTSSDAIVLTHMGTALLVLFLIGTAVWGALGLPDNVFLR
jgi:4-hydroxybenzoate polyprenyltransferase